MPLHADAIAEDGPTGEGTVGINGQDCNPPTLATPELGQPVHQGALAASRRSSQADDLGVGSGGGHVSDRELLD
jgi:hypothetical protein